MNTIRLFAFADEASKMFSGQLDAMERNGLQGLEIRGVDGQNVSKIPLDKARQLRRQMDDRGLITWSIGSPIGKIHMEEDFAAHLETLRHCLEVANILGAENLRLFSFFMKPEDIDRNRSQVIDRMGAFLEIGQRFGVNICHENEKGIYGATAQCCLDILTQLPAIKGIFDPANFVQCAVDTVAAWELLKERTHYLHIKDALPDGTVVPAGCGQGNVSMIVKDFVARGGREMTVEPHLKVFAGLKDLEQQERQSKVGAFQYPNADAAFDAACNAIKTMIREEVL